MNNVHSMQQVNEDAQYPGIVAIIGCYGPLEPHGKRGYQGYCPFCSTIDATLYVRPDLDEWHCFECGAGGDAYDFVSRMEVVDRPTAMALVARRLGSCCGSPLREVPPVAPAAPPVSAEILSLPTPAAKASVEASAPAPVTPPAAAKPASAPRPREHNLPLFSSIERIPGYLGAAVLDGDGSVLVEDERLPVAAATLEATHALAAKAFECSRAVFGDAANASDALNIFSLCGGDEALIIARVGHGASTRMLHLRVDDGSNIVAARLRLSAVRSLIAATAAP